MTAHATMVGADESETVTVLNPKGEARDTINFYGRADQLMPGPQAFLAALPPHGVGRAHFHPVDQFQVFLPAAGAAYQRTALDDDVMIHYADAYTTYGPFTADAEPLRFFTLRPRHEAEIGYMPEDRAKLVKRGRRTIHRLLNDVVADTRAGGVAIAELFSDRAAAWRVSLAPGAALPDPSGGEHGGQYVCVVSGSVQLDGRTWHAPALGWVERGEPMPRFVAADGGADVVIMRFAAETAAG